MKPHSKSKESTSLIPWLATTPPSQGVHPRNARKSGMLQEMGMEQSWVSPAGHERAQIPQNSTARPQIHQDSSWDWDFHGEIFPNIQPGLTSSNCARGGLQVGYSGIFPHGKDDQVLEGAAQGRAEPPFPGIIPKTPGSGTWGMGFGGICLNLRGFSSWDNSPSLGVPNSSLDHPGTLGGPKIPRIFKDLFHPKPFQDSLSWVHGILGINPSLSQVHGILSLFHGFPIPGIIQNQAGAAWDGGSCSCPTNSTIPPYRPADPLMSGVLET